MSITMTWIDWAIVAAVFVFITSMAIFTKRYNRSVADFLTAGRCAGRYLMLVSGEMVSVSAIAIVAQFEMHYASGFSMLWWWLMIYPIRLVLRMFGWLIFRYRETRVMTLGQLFEVRYSKNFRIFTGILGWLSGIVNFGIFPAVGGRFFMYFCGLPHSYMLFGLEVSTFATIVFVLISVAVFFTIIGGQIAVMVTDFLQASVTMPVVIGIIAYFLIKFDFSAITDTMIRTAESGQSLVNPFHTTQIKGFSIWYFMMFFFVGELIGPELSWQGAQGYNCSAKSAHEMRMARILATLRTNYHLLIALVLAISAYVVMNHPEYVGLAADINTSLDSAVSHISADPNNIVRTTIHTQMIVPVALSKMLPVGLIGAFCAVMLAAFISTHDTYLHSWGSIFIQDVILPFRKKPFTPKQHLLLLRLSIVFVAIFIFFFSLLFTQIQYIMMFFMITGSIFTGGVGAVIIGGLYWKRGTAAAAWTSMIFGSITSVTMIIVQQLWPRYHDNADFPLSGMTVLFIVTMISIGLYGLVSLGGKKVVFNLERMLHRGKYAIKGQEKETMPKGFGALGFSKELPRNDKLIYLIVAIWVLSGLAVFVYFSIYQATIGLSDHAWATIWKYYVWIAFIMTVCVSVWFLIGGIINLKELFTALAKAKRNELDDGMVVNHHSLGEELVEQSTETRDSDQEN